MENFVGLYTCTTFKPYNSVAVDTISLLLHMKNLRFIKCSTKDMYECFTMSVHHVCAYCPWRLEKGLGSSDLPCVGNLSLSFYS